LATSPSRKLARGAGQPTPENNMRASFLKRHKKLDSLERSPDGLDDVGLRVDIDQIRQSFEAFWDIGPVFKPRSN